ERLWSRAMVLVSSMWGVATLAGPAIGGVFAETGHWRLAFWSVLPIAALLALLVMTQLNAGERPAKKMRVQTPIGRVLMLALAVLTVSGASLSSSMVWNAVCVAFGLHITLWMARFDSRLV